MSHRLRLLFALLLLSGGMLPARTASAAPPSPWDNPEAVAGELVVGFESSLQAAAFRAPAGATAGEGSRQLRRLGATVVKVPPGQEEKYARELADQPGVEFVEPNYIVTADLIPDDTLWAGQYGPTNIQAPAAWDVTTGSGSVIVAVIDSGIDADHPEFAGRILPGYDFVDDDSTPQDTCGHGTHVAGTIAAEGNNAEGVAGLAWGTSIMPVRVLTLTPLGCGGSTADIAEALVWAVERGARVINLSLGTASPSTLLENGTYYAYSQGAAIFAASGNSGSSIVLYPAAYSWVLAVGATDSGNARASFSNRGAALDVMAPGVNILSTLPPGAYGNMSGTSMATAHASGAGALLATQPAFDSADAIYQVLESTALDLGAAGRDDQTGYGLIQIADALAFDPTATPPPPITPIISYDVLNSLTCGNLASYNWREAAAEGLPAALPVFGNDGYATVGLPFTFNFGSVDYSTLTVSANGYATFNGLGYLSANFLLPGHAQPDNFVAPFWDDLTASTGGIIYQQTNGTAPNREYVVEWQGVTISGQTSPLTFELILFESSGDILFQYNTLTGSASDGSSATIGVEYADGLTASQYSYNRTGAVQEGQALLFRPYPTGDTPPSEACATFTRLVDSGGGFFEEPPWCVDIAPGELSGTGTLEIQVLTDAATMPSNWLDLRHYADISLLLNPPVPLQPFPQVSVCYAYTPADVLDAGGDPENLFIASFDSGRWTALPTSLDVAHQRISAIAPHLSVYGVAATRPATTLPELQVEKVLATMVFSNRAEMEITYTISIENTGGTALHDLQVTDDLIATFGSGNFTLNSVSSAAFAENPGYNGDTDINLLAGTDTLAIGGSGTLTVVVTARIVQGETYANTATGSGVPPSGPPVEDDGTVSGPEFADPLLTKASDISEAAVGDSVTYTITVTNQGNQDATNVIVTDTLPSNLRVDGAESTKGTVTNTPPRTVQVDIGTVTPGEIVTITIHATIISGSPSTITNTARLTTDTATDNPLNNSDNDAITIPGAVLPETGFAPGRLSSLGQQPANRAYYAPGDIKLVIPSLKVNIPVVGVPKVHGTWDVSWLWTSAGYLNGSAFPTTSGNSVITGHVYLPTGLPGPFVNIGSLNWGDQVIVYYAGQQYVYSVRTVQVLEPDDVNVVMKHQDDPWITLLTCRSYDEKTDTYRQRAVVSAVLIAVR